MKTIARLAIVGMLLTAIGFARQPKYRWGKDSVRYDYRNGNDYRYRVTPNRNYGYRGTQHRNYGYRNPSHRDYDYRGNSYRNLPPTYPWRQNRDWYRGRYRR